MQKTTERESTVEEVWFEWSRKPWISVFIRNFNAQVRTIFQNQNYFKIRIWFCVTESNIYYMTVCTAEQVLFLASAYRSSHNLVLEWKD